MASQVLTTTNSASQITIDWQDTERNESGWEVHRSTAGVSGTFTLRASLAANTTQHSDGGLNQLTEYCYKVRSFRRVGAKTTYSAFTNASCSRTFGPPAPPSDIVARPRNSTEIDLTWVNNAMWPYSQRLEISSSDAGPWQLYRTFAGGTTAFLDQSVSVEQVRCYRLVAVNAYGETPAVPACTVAPGVPGNTSATASGASIVVAWTDNSAFEDGYEVQRSGDENPQFATIATLAANATNFSDAAVTLNTRYWYRVRARRDGGFSSASDVTSAVVMTSPPVSPEGTAAYATGSTVNVYFTESFGATSFRLERSMDDGGSWVTAGAGAGSPFTDEGRPLEARACYRVIAANAIGESAPSNVDCTTPLTAPTNIIQDWQGDGTVILTWNDNSGVETAYEIWVVDCSVYVDCEYRYIDLPANSTSLVLGPYEGFAFMYAYNEAGVSDVAYEGASAADQFAPSSVPLNARMVRATTSRAAPCVAFSGRLSQSQSRACSSPPTPVRSPNRR